MTRGRILGVLCIAAGTVTLARCPDSNVISGPETTATPARSDTPTRTPDSNPTPTLTPATPTPPPAHTPTPGIPATRTGTGSTTWTSMVATRPLCPELLNQVGSSYSLTITVQTSGTAVALTLDHHDDEPGRYSGTLAGKSITAVYEGPFGGLACPGDSVITRQTAGHLTATLTHDEISGQYDEVYGAAPDDVTLHFVFQARLAAP